jgi:hypothetical protein
MVKCFVVAVCLIFSATSVMAHSGGTDYMGCHFNRKTDEYHCH